MMVDAVNRVYLQHVITSSHQVEKGLNFFKLLKKEVNQLLKIAMSTCSKNDRKFVDSREMIFQLFDLTGYSQSDIWNIYFE